MLSIVLECFVFSTNFSLFHSIFHHGDSVHLKAHDRPLEPQFVSMCHGESLCYVLLRNDSLQREEDCFGSTTPSSHVIVNQFTIMQEQSSEDA